MALAQVEPVANDRARIVGMAMMAVTADWIPVESSYEQQVADTLVSRKRAFNKPLRYDARTDEVFPDFILLDAFDGRQVPMEVFGLKHASVRLPPGCVGLGREAQSGHARCGAPGDTVAGKRGRPRRWPGKLHADKGYDFRRAAPP